MFEYQATQRPAAEIRAMECAGAVTPEPDDFVPVFVGGAPRSGTTALHALICTAPKVNRYIAEASYFRGFMYPLEVGLAGWETHTKHYFASQEELFANHASVLNTELRKIWNRLDRPEILALKEPTLTLAFPQLAKLMPKAKFVVTVRDPRSTISSRLEVMLRDGANPGKDDVQALCDEFVDYYYNLIHNLDDFGGRLCFVDYEQMVRGRAGNVIERLEAFGLGPLHPEKMWEEAIGNPKGDTGIWQSPLYGAPLSSASVERYQKILPEEIESFILDRCGEIAQKAGLGQLRVGSATASDATGSAAATSAEQTTKELLLKGWLAPSSGRGSDWAGKADVLMELDRLRRDEQAYRAQIEEAHRLLASVMNSRSWRMMGALRKVTGLFSKGKLG